MQWENIISFSDHNKPYRFRVTTSTAANSDQCKVFAEELDESDHKTDEFNFVYDTSQEMPLADVELHEKPIMVLIAQMLSVHDDPKNGDCLKRQVASDIKYSLIKFLMEQDLQRFEKAHQQDFKTALSEIRNGKKVSHWMWYIFPQLKGLGFSETAKYYSIENLVTAQEFLDHPVLGKNMLLICTALLELKVNNATVIFGKPDDLKLHSSISLFSLISNSNIIFQKVLNKYFDGKPDPETIKLLFG